MRRRRIAVKDRRTGRPLKGAKPLIAGRPLSPRRQGQIPVSDREKQFKDLAEKSLVGIYLIQNGFFTYVNPRLAEIFGYTAEEIVGTMGPKDLVAADDWSLVDGNIRKRIAGEAKSFHYEFRGRKKTGETINVEAYGSRTENGGRPALIGTLLDITERKRSEELLKDAEEKYRSIFENAVEGVFQTTPEGQFLAVNPTLARMLGYDSTEDLMVSLNDIGQQIYVEPTRRSELMRILEQEGVALGFECELFTKGGRKITAVVNVRSVLDRNGTAVCYEGMIEDISERKKVEETLNRLHELHRAIIENAPVSIFTLDKDGVFTSVNPALAFLSDLGPKTEAKLVGFNWVKNPYTIQCGLAAHIERGLQGEAFQLWDFPFVSYTGGRNLYMDFNGVPLKGKDGAVEGLLCIIEETTDRVKTRAKLMQEGKMSAIGKLAAGIAHELNNPLATLVAYAELARDSLEGFGASIASLPPVEELKGYLGIIEEQAFRCKSVVGDILSLPRKEGLDIRAIDLNRIVENVVELIRVERSHVKILEELSPSLPPVPGDTRALRQVLVNLISNGLDAVEGRMNPTLWIRTKPGVRKVVIEIEDNGIGIPDTIVDKIFEPFYTTKESKKGIGLGLSLSSELIRDMGGTIRVESKPRRGTTFFIALPTRDEGGSP
jgi:two-component system cell cycle sensor histidine kinase/response regulator CckA